MVIVDEDNGFGIGIVNFVSRIGRVRVRFCIISFINRSFFIGTCSRSSNFYDLRNNFFRVYRGCYDRFFGYYYLVFFSVFFILRIGRG